MKEMLYTVRCLKSNEDMILALAGQFKELSHELKSNEDMILALAGQLKELSHEPIP